jgi:hypothetical protein
VRIEKVDANEVQQFAVQGDRQGRMAGQVEQRSFLAGIAAFPIPAQE